MSDPTSAPPFDWEAAGRELGATLDGLHVIVVTGLDPVATGYVALGIGRAQAIHRRAAVGDLFADSPPIQALVGSDDPHGLVDSFLYGVSLSRIARAVPDAGQLVVMPSGSEPPTFEEMLPNPRWHRLSAGFREAGALFVVAVPASAAHIEDLAAVSDGVVLVGEAHPAALSETAVIAVVREPTQVPIAVPVAQAAARATGRPPRPAPPPVRAVPSRGARALAQVWTRLRSTSAAGLLLSATIIAVFAWLAYRPLARMDHTSRGPKPDTARKFAGMVPMSPDSTPISGITAAATVPTPIPHAANVDDSAQAAVYAVELPKENTEAGAIMKLQVDRKNLPAATFAPVLIESTRWFKVICGAFVDRDGADSLLAGLRRRKVLDEVSGSVVRVPFAFLIDSVIPAAVAGMLTTYADQGQPLYALRQPNGYAWLLVGAFQTEEESSLYAESLRSSGITPVLVYRKGRTF